MFLVASQSNEQKQPVDYVSPNIGGIGQLLTATIPLSNNPRYGAVGSDYDSWNYRSVLADKIYGFPAGPAMLMASVGPQSNHPEAYASEFDHDFELPLLIIILWIWKPGHKGGITGLKVLFYRFTFSREPSRSLGVRTEKDAELTVVETSHTRDSTYSRTDRESLRTRMAKPELIFMRSSPLLRYYKTWRNDDDTHAPRQSDNHIGFVADFPSTSGEQIEVRVGLSYIRQRQARRNLQREIPDWNFERVKSETRAVWNKALSEIQN